VGLKSGLGSKSKTRRPDREALAARVYELADTQESLDANIVVVLPSFPSSLAFLPSLLSSRGPSEVLDFLLGFCFPFAALLR